MTDIRLLGATTLLTIFAALAHGQDEPATAQPQRPIMTVDGVSTPFPGGLRFSADKAALWTNQLEAWGVRDGQQVDSSEFQGRKGSRHIIDLVGNHDTMLIAVPKSGELLFWDHNKGLRQRSLDQVGTIVAARFIDQGKRFALVFSDPPSIYYGEVDSNENDSTTALQAEVSRCAISPDGHLVAVQHDRDINIWDVQTGRLATTLKHEHKPFSFTFSPDGQTIATGTANDNMVRVFDTGEGKLKHELKAHTQGKIFLTTAVYALAFSPNGKFLASGGHDGQVIVWDLAHGKPVWQTQIAGPPIVCSLSFSADSSLLAGGFENANAKRGLRVWNVSADMD